MRPIVDPGPPLPPGDQARFSRHILLPQVGDVGQRRLRAASVCVVGAGGLGSPALLYLAAAGVGRLGVVDADVVEPTNLHRQVVHGPQDLGRRKVLSARDAVRALDPAIRVDAHDVALTDRNAAAVLDGYDVVLDGTDTFATRHAVNDACAAAGVPLVWGSVLGFDALVTVFWAAPPDGDPVDLRDLFPQAPDDGPTCAQAGVLGPLCGQVGALMATEAVKLVTGAGEPLLGRVLVLDALAARWREVPLARGAAEPATASTSVQVSEPAPTSVRVSDSTPTAPGPTSAAGPTAPEPTIEATELADRLRAGEQVAVVDVRDDPGPGADGIPGAVHVPLADLAGGRTDALPPGSPLVLYCTAGVRSALAVRLAHAAGRPDAVALRGGLAAWRVVSAEALPAGGARPGPASARDGRTARHVDPTEHDEAGQRARLTS